MANPHILGLILLTKIFITWRELVKLVKLVKLVRKKHITKYEVLI
jgi:hypothetical protein